MPARGGGSEAATRRVGILGGTFDPVHVGHLAAAANVRAALGLDTVQLVVANQPWQKIDGRVLSPAADRLALVEAALEGVHGIEASSIEIDRGGLTYTADTIGELRLRHPRDELFLIVGADVAGTIDTWRRTDEIAREVTLVVMNRAGSPAVDTVKLTADGWDAVPVEIPALEISSTELRRRAMKGEPLDFLTPAAVMRVITERGLYAAGR